MRRSSKFELSAKIVSGDDEKNLSATWIERLVDVDDVSDVKDDDGDGDGTRAQIVETDNVSLF